MANEVDRVPQPTPPNDDAGTPPDRFGALAGRAPVMRQLLAQLHRIAATDTTVLIEGETGTGKLVVAREIARQGRRSARPLVILECNGIAPSDLELQLFGYESTGALTRADTGTLVIDEIAALPLTAQARLLRTMETGTLQPLGGTETSRIDARIVAITHEDLGRMCEQRQFRRDLYFCLRALRVRVPPLRQRLADLPLLVEAMAAEEGVPPELHADPDFVDWLRGRYWHGNLRELRNVMQRVRALGLLAVIDEMDQPPAASRMPRPSLSARGQVVERIEHAYLVRLLRQHSGNVTQAARAARRTSSWLRRRIQHHGIDLSHFRLPADVAG